MRLLCVARGLSRLSSQEALAEDPVLLGRDLKARRSLATRNILLLGWNLDDWATCQRLARVVTHWVVLVPPAEMPSSGVRGLGDAAVASDARSKRLATAINGHRPRGQTTICDVRGVRGVYVSTTGVYGNHAGAFVSETSLCKTQQLRSLRRLHAERLWRLQGFHRLRVPGITSEEKLPVDRIRAGARMLRAEDDVYTNHIHADDLARICWAALWRGRPGRVTNTVCEGSMPMGDYYDAVADGAGLSRPPRLSRTEFEGAVRRGEISPMTASFMQDSRRVVSARLADELGISLRYPTIGHVIRNRFRQKSAVC
jgi:dTDP-4-dehydrorhamnose reductase